MTEVREKPLRADLPPHHKSEFQVMESQVTRTATLNAPTSNTAGDCLVSDPETGVVLGLTQDRNMRSRYRCSMCPAIHTNSRSWLRSSSTQVPSDPPFRAVFFE